MKKTPENAKLLKKLGFVNTDDDWYKFKDGWTFKLSEFKSFPSLIQRLISYTDNEEG